MKSSETRRILVVASTFPSSDDDPVPGFVKEQVIALKKDHPELEFAVLAPHDLRSGTKPHTKHGYYDEYRFHYMWPRNLEVLAGHGILPALKKTPLLYLVLPFFIIGEFIGLRRLSVKLKPDLIYAHWFTPQAINAAVVSKLTSVPFVFTTHASDVSVLNKIPFGGTLVRWVCLRAAAYTAVSERTAAKLVAFFDKDSKGNTLRDKLSIIPMGINSKQFNKINNDSADMKNLLFVGRLAEKKGVTYLLSAFASVLKNSPDLTLTIAGDGPLKTELQQQADDLHIAKHVNFVGYVTGDEKNKLYKNAGILVIPSIITDDGDAEGLPVVLMEGLASGKVIITSDVTGGESIIRDGVSGYIFPQKSSEKLADSITRVLELSPVSANMMQRKSVILCEQFDWSLIARKHYDVLTGVVGQ